MDNSTTVQYATLMFQFTAKARSSVRDIDSQNDLTFVRIRTKKHEIMIAPGKSRYSIICRPSPNPLSTTHPSHSQGSHRSGKSGNILKTFSSQGNQKQGVKKVGTLHSETGLGTKMRFELLFIFISLK